MSHEPDDGYKAMFGDYISPFAGPGLRYGSSFYKNIYGTVPEIEKGTAITGGVVLELDDDRLLLELSGRHFFSDTPEIYNEEEGRREEAYLGFTYYLN